MAEKHVKTRIVNKHDTAENWAKATNFVPLKGEIIIYDVDTNHNYERFKIGDGVKQADGTVVGTRVNDLPFADDTKLDKTGGTINGDLKVVGNVTLNDGQATGAYSIAAGSTNKDAVSGLLGSLASASVTVNAPKAEATNTISIGSGTEARSTGSNAIGVMSTSGVKGLYYKSISFSNKTITLSNKRNTQSGSNLAATYGWSVGDTVSFVNDYKYPACATITNISGNVITLDKLPFTSSSDIVTYSSLSELTYTPDDFTIFACYKKEEVNYLNKVTNSRWYPRNGAIELGWAGTAFGIENLVTGTTGFATGWNNWVAGDFGFASGRDNIAGYSAIASGINNKAISEGTATFGHNCTATATNSVAAGNSSIVDGAGAGVALGQACQARACGAIALGSNVYTNYSDNNDSSGDGTGHYRGQVVVGRYNDNPGSNVFVVGAGSKSTAFNALEISSSNAKFKVPLAVIGNLTNTGNFESGSSTATGIRATAIGTSSTASGNHSLAGGSSTIASGSGSMSFGFNSEASNTAAFALGHTVAATGIGAISLGRGSNTPIVESTGKSIALMWNKVDWMDNYEDDYHDGDGMTNKEYVNIGSQLDPADTDVCNYYVDTYFYNTLNTPITFSGKLYRTYFERFEDGYFDEEIGHYVFTQDALVDANTYTYSFSETIPTGESVCINFGNLDSNLPEVNNGNYEMAAYFIVESVTLNSIKYGTSAGDGSLAAGYDNLAIGKGSAAIGYQNKASGEYAVALTATTIADGKASIAGGYGSKTTAQSAIALGQACEARGLGSAAIGSNVIAGTRRGQVVVGAYNDNSSYSGSGYNEAIFVVGDGTDSKRHNALVVTNNHICLNNTVQIGGTSSTSSSYLSASGTLHYDNCYSIGENSIAIGANTRAEGSFSFAGGSGTSLAKGEGSFAFGYGAKAYGRRSVALGQACESYNLGSVAIGSDLVTYGSTNAETSDARGQFVCGRYNTVPDIDDIFIVGAGTATNKNKRKNVFKIKTNGTMVVGEHTFTADAFKKLLLLVDHITVNETTGDITLK